MRICRPSGVPCCTWTASRESANSTHIRRRYSRVDDTSTARSSIAAKHPPVEPPGRVALQLVLVRKVAVQRAHADAGTLGDGGHRRAERALRRHEVQERVDDPLPHVVVMGGPRTRAGDRLRHVTNHDMLARVMSSARVDGSGRSWDDGAVKWATAAAECSACESGAERSARPCAGTSGKEPPPPPSVSAVTPVVTVAAMATLSARERAASPIGRSPTSTHVAQGACRSTTPPTSATPSPVSTRSPSRMTRPASGPAGGAQGGPAVPHRAGRVHHQRVGGGGSPRRPALPTGFVTLLMTDVEGSTGRAAARWPLRRADRRRRGRAAPGPWTPVATRWRPAPTSSSPCSRRAGGGRRGHRDANGVGGPGVARRCRGPCAHRHPQRVPDVDAGELRRDRRQHDLTGCAAGHGGQIVVTANTA